VAYWRSGFCKDGANFRYITKMLFCITTLHTVWLFRRWTSSCFTFKKQFKIVLFYNLRFTLAASVADSINHHSGVCMCVCLSFPFSCLSVLKWRIIKLSSTQWKQHTTRPVCILFLLFEGRHSYLFRLRNCLQLIGMRVKTAYAGICSKATAARWWKPGLPSVPLKPRTSICLSS